MGFRAINLFTHCERKRGKEKADGLVDVGVCALKSSKKEMRVDENWLCFQLWKKEKESGGWDLKLEMSLYLNFKG